MNEWKKHPLITIVQLQKGYVGFHYIDSVLVINDMNMYVCV